MHEKRNPMNLVQNAKLFYRRLPKVELHRHLEGSLRMSTIRDIARGHKLDLPGTDRLPSLVQIQNEEPNTPANFLSKFDTLRLMYRSPEIIRRVTAEIIADAAADNIHHLELRFTPVALSRVRGYSLADVMDWVAESAREAAQAHRISTVLIASVNRHESPALAEQVAGLAVERRALGIVGLDLAGDETAHRGARFAGIFREAKRAGLRITVHAGEWGEAENIIEAIKTFGAERIGHGVRVLENPDAVRLARDSETVFEVCPTSNVQSGVVSSIQEHPLPGMIAAGLKVTLNTDDPGISCIELHDEYQIACEQLSLSLGDLRQCALTAAAAAFLQNGASETLQRDISQGYALT